MGDFYAFRINKGKRRSLLDILYRIMEKPVFEEGVHKSNLKRIVEDLSEGSIPDSIRVMFKEEGDTTLSPGASVVKSIEEKGLWVIKDNDKLYILRKKKQRKGKGVATETVIGAYERKDEFSGIGKIIAPKKHRGYMVVETEDKGQLIELVNKVRKTKPSRGGRLIMVSIRELKEKEPLSPEEVKEFVRAAKGKQKGKRAKYARGRGVTVIKGIHKGREGTIVATPKEEAEVKLEESGGLPGAVVSIPYDRLRLLR